MRAETVQRFIAAIDAASTGSKPPTLKPPTRRPPPRREGYVVRREIAALEQAWGRLTKGTTPTAPAAPAPAAVMDTNVIECSSNAVAAAMEATTTATVDDAEPGQPRVTTIRNSPGVIECPNPLTSRAR